ncbi:hypothetical protein [Parvularcula dongshanensis]|uniref:Uncharacterized protein n=1 Tax=Parvularcula dongshanensis TaxID=1173995 RepID=A0A840I850_9PROT|nr:hypothetical protein [Parvularcula dongshanensis]MBB4660334.1 hypothetical protein [Parvularcula dongshanensis]
MSRYLLIAVATAAITGLLSWLLGRSKPAEQTATTGRITPTKWIAWATVFGGVVMAAGGIALIVMTVRDGAAGVGLGIGLALMGLAIGGFMLPSLGRWHDVT